MKKLYPHNQKAYEAVIKSFNEGNRKACIVHATGSGKSFCIAAVAKHFSNVLIIAPNNYVLDETRALIKKAHFQTYSSLLHEQNRHTGYDLIVLDEFHRTGAEKWGKALHALLEANPDAKILGASATYIRYLDDMRDMADEIFDGNVVSRLTLCEALNKGILPMPTYVSGLFSIDDTKKKYKEKIENSKLDIEDKKKQISLLNSIARSWKMSHGVPQIMEKYFRSDMQRIIVFCSNIIRARRISTIMRGWLSSAGFCNVQFYSIDSSEQRKADKAMDEFRKPCTKGQLKVAIAVNMLNEGVHVPNVDGIIMLRSTSSRIILEQQIGRCLTADNSRKAPVVLDLVNNMELLDYSYIFKREDLKRRSADFREYVEDMNEPFPFDIIDEAGDIREMIAALDEKLDDRVVWDVETVKEMAKLYRLRTDFAKDYPSAYRWAYKNNCIDEVFPHIPLNRHRWSLEEVRECALKCKTRAEFMKSYPREYNWAHKNNCIDEVCAHCPNQSAPKWDIHTATEEAKKYQTRKEFEKGSSGAYGWAHRHNLLNEVCKHMKASKTAKKWTWQTVLAVAMECESLSEFKTKYPGAHNYIKTNELKEIFLEKCPQLTGFEGRISEDDIYSEAKKYTRRSDFKNNSNRAYGAAQRLGILDKVCAHMPKFSLSAGA